MGARGTCQGLTAWVRFLSEKRRCVSLFHQCRILLTTSLSLQKDTTLGTVTVDVTSTSGCELQPHRDGQEAAGDPGTCAQSAERPVAGVRVTSRGAPSPLPGGELTTDRQVEIGMGNPKPCYHHREPSKREQASAPPLRAFSERFL